MSVAQMPSLGRLCEGQRWDPVPGGEGPCLVPTQGAAVTVRNNTGASAAAGTGTAVRRRWRTRKRHPAAGRACCRSRCQEPARGPLVMVCSAACGGLVEGAGGRSWHFEDARYFVEWLVCGLGCWRRAAAGRSPVPSTPARQQKGSAAGWGARRRLQPLCRALPRGGRLAGSGGHPPRCRGAEGTPMCGLHPA